MLKYVGAYHNNLVVQHKVGRPSVFHLKKTLRMETRQHDYLLVIINCNKYLC